MIHEYSYTLKLIKCIFFSLSQNLLYKNNNEIIKSPYLREYKIKFFHLSFVNYSTFPILC